MSRRTGIILLAVAGTLALLLFSPPGQVIAQSVQRVIVTNLPDVQTVDGAVSIEGAVRLSEMVAFKEILVPPVEPTETTRLVNAGTLLTDGFANVVLSLHGQVRGSPKRPGDVGVFLVPDEQMIQDAFNELGLVHFALRTGASPVSADTPFFASAQPRYTVGFESYRVLLYNTTDKTVTVNLFAYLTN